MLAVAVADSSEFASDPYYARVIAGAHEETARHGLSLSVHVARLRSLAGLAPFGGSPRHLRIFQPGLADRRADGP